ncbi:hypothetical protein HMPREF2891_08160 [Actinomyces sp. HMSC065F11]|nr:hypothetical protein HMPREF2891_08160 [Actinomyces sp. HMSC065F11]
MGKLLLVAGFVVRLCWSDLNAGGASDRNFVAVVLREVATSVRLLVAASLVDCFFGIEVVKPARLRSRATGGASGSETG